MFTNTNGEYDMDYEFEALAVGEHTYDGIANYSLDITVDESGAVPENIQPVGFEILKRFDRYGDTGIEVKKLDAFEVFRIFQRIEHGRDGRNGSSFDNYCADWASERYDQNHEGRYGDSDYDPYD
jgi:hypothetical protein